MGYKNDFFGGSLNQEDIKRVSKWEVDRILSTVSTMKTGSSKKHKISDKEIDKILSEEFIPILKREVNNQKNISGDTDKKSPDITVIKAKRQENSSKNNKEQIKKSAKEKNDKIKEKTQPLNIKADKKADTYDFSEPHEEKLKKHEKEVTKEIEAIIKSKPTVNKKKSISIPKEKRNNSYPMLVSVLSFLCLALCVLLCICLVSVRR